LVQKYCFPIFVGILRSFSFQKTIKVDTRVVITKKGNIKNNQKFGEEKMKNKITTNLEMKK